jgi:hypothetical protein
MMRPSLRSILNADAAVEALCAACLLAGAGAFSRWLDISVGTSLGLSAVFAGAAVAVALLARPALPQPDVVRALAFANIVGGATAWLLLLVFWGRLEPSGRAFVGVAGDVFIVLGWLEVRALAGARRAGDLKPR